LEFCGWLAGAKELKGVAHERGHQLDAAIRIFFQNELLAIHTLSRAAFRILFDITKEGETKAAYARSFPAH
jgi:hypothetical protein